MPFNLVFKTNTDLILRSLAKRGVSKDGRIT